MTREFVAKSIVKILLVVVLVFLLFSLTGTSFAYDSVKFDDTKVLDDLRSSTIKDKPFDETKYSFNNDEELSVISVVEYCYSYKKNLQANYGLYFYIYNPKGLDIDVYNKANKVQLAKSFNDKGSATEYDKFQLRYLSSSEETVKKNLFYKFKVADSNAILPIVEGKEQRRYDISGIQLVTKGTGNAKEYPVKGSYKFMGYAKGYGMDMNSESTLVSTQDSLETIELSVTPTIFRTVSSSVGVDHRNQLNSVYFSVPNKYIRKYGNLNKIMAEWNEYQLSPVLVTNNSEVFNGLTPYLSVATGGYNRSIPYEFATQYKHVSNTNSSVTTMDLGYNIDMSYKGGLGFMYSITRNQDIPVLANMFKVVGNVHEQTVSAKTMLDYMRNYKKSSNNQYIDLSTKYSADLFTNKVDTDRIRGYNKISFDNQNTKFNMLTYSDTKSFWDKLWSYGLNPPKDESFTQIKPIYEVGAGELLDTDVNVAKKLLIDINDVKQFKADYSNSALEDKSTFLFRFAQTDY